MEVFRKASNSSTRDCKREFFTTQSESTTSILHFKEVGKFWSVRAGIGYRALAVKDQDNFIWVWIGPHGEYDRLINS